MSVGAVNKQTGERIPTAGMPAIDDALDLTSVNPVQNAIITAALANKQDKTDNALQTTDKTVVGAINEHEGDIDSLKSGFTNLDNEVNGSATTYPYADVITISDAVPSNLADCTVKIEPVQDLHGYDNPWVGGAGKNKLPLTLDNLKSVNTTGTWADNVFSLNGVDFTVNVDNDGNVTGITANGTASANVNFFFVRNSQNIYSGYILNGCVGGSNNSYYIALSLNASPWTTNTCFNSDTTITIPETATIECYIRVASGYVANNVVFRPMIRLATETDSTFAPYTNICPISGHTEAVVTVADDDTDPTVTNTYTIALGDTIYGGTVDFDSGVMTVDRAVIEYDGSNDENWLLDEGTHNFFYIELTGRDATKAVIANNCVNASISKTTTDLGVGTDARYLRYRYANDNSLTVSDLKTFLASNNLQVCYYIATPTTIQLTPQQIQLLKGQNTLTASTGQISVTVNGVSGSIGQVQEQVNDLAEDVVNIATAVATKADYRKYSISKNTSSYIISDLSDIFMSIMAVTIPPGYSYPVNGLYVLYRQGNTLSLIPLHETASTLGLTATLTDGNIVLAWTASNIYGGTIALIDLYKYE